MKRNLVSITCYFCTGIVIARFIPLDVTIWLVLAGTAFLVNIYFFFYRKKIHFMAMLVCIIFAGSFWYGLSRASEYLYQDMAGQLVEGEGAVQTYPRQSEYYLSFTVDVRNLACQNRVMTGVEKLLIKVKRNENGPVLPGNSVFFRGVLSLPQGPNNPGEFDYREYLANQQTFYIVTCSQRDFRALEEGKSFRTLAAYGREKVTGVLDDILPEKEKGLLLGLLFGDTSGIPGDDWEGYQRAGVVHLFAVSGFNIAFVLGVVWFFLSFFNPSPLWRLLWGVPVLIGYFFLVGWTASIVRASLMAFFGLAALMAGQKQDIYTSLSLAAFIILIISPGELFQVSFQLSFAATGGIVYLTPYLERRGLGKIFSAALAAQFATLPLVALYFNQISLLAPLLNIFAVMVSGFVTVISLVGCLLTWSVQFLAEPLFVTGGSMMYLLSRFILAAAELDWAAVTVPAPPLFIVIVYYIFFVLIPLSARLKPALNHVPAKIKSLALAVLLIGLLVSCWPQPGRMEVVFLDVGQGDSIFIRTPGGRTVLLDGGGTPDSEFAVGKKTVKPYLQHRGLGKIDVMIMSHNDLDHSEGLVELIPSIPVGLFLMPPAETDNEIEQKIRQLCGEKKIPVNELTAGQRISLDKQVYLDVLHPVKGDEHKGNNHSLVLRLIYKEAEWLLTGDIENEGLDELMSRTYNLNADVLKLSHHGSISSYNPEFYEKVKPRAVVASVGVNMYNQPHPKVVEYFDDHKVPFYATVERGAVLTESDGLNIRIKTMR